MIGILMFLLLIFSFALLMLLEHNVIDEDYYNDKNDYNGEEEDSEFKRY